MKTKRYTLATTSNEGFTYDEYAEWCEINERKPAGEESREFYEWAGEEARENWEFDIDNIHDFDPYKVPVMITGTLGLWWGHPDIEPVRCESVYEAVMKCAASGDEVDVTWEEGVVHVDAHHHDGTNCFEIRPVDGSRLKYLYN